jgi:hypothetical protein
MKNLPVTDFDRLITIRTHLTKYLDKAIEILSLSNESLVPLGNVPDTLLPLFSEYFWDEQHMFRAQFMAKNRFNTERQFRAMAQSHHQFDFMTQIFTFEFISTLNFKLFGQKVFNLSDNLVDRLAITELNVPPSEVKLPFKSCMFVLTGETAIKSFLAATDSDMSYDSVKDSTLSVYLSEDKYKHLDKILMYGTLTHKDDSYCAIKREILLRDDWDIEQCLSTDWIAVQKEFEGDRDIPRGKSYKDSGKTLLESEDDSQFYNEGMTFFRIMMNAIIYLSSNKPDINEVVSISKEKTESTNNNATSSILNSFAVGFGLEVIRVAKNKIISGKEHSASLFEMLRRMVRGHWKNQVCGKGLKDRKRIFVEPYSRGNDAAEFVNTPYQVC